MNYIKTQTEDWPASLQLILAGYISKNRLDETKLLRVDLVLILLRLADGAADDFVRKECLERVAELTGKAITQCPSAMPPWPPMSPGAPGTRTSGPKVTNVIKPNPCVGEMAHRYNMVKVGMTVPQLLTRGVTSRDIRYWVKLGHITITGGKDRLPKKKGTARGEEACEEDHQEA